MRSTRDQLATQRVGALGRGAPREPLPPPSCARGDGVCSAPPNPVPHPRGSAGRPLHPLPAHGDLSETPGEDTQRVATGRAPSRSNPRASPALAEKDKFGENRSEKCGGAGRRAGTHAAYQGADPQAGPHGGGRGVGRRPRASGSCRALGARAWPLPASGPAPAPPHLPKPLDTFRWLSAPPLAHLRQVRGARW